MAAPPTSDDAAAAPPTPAEPTPTHSVAAAAPPAEPGPAPAAIEPTTSAEPGPATYALPAELIANCKAKTDAALAKLTLAVPPRSHLRKVAEDFLEMAKAYRSDTDYFLKQGKGGLALEAVAYAHGWLDAGARLGLFEVGEDDQLFTLAE